MAEKQYIEREAAVEILKEKSLKMFNAYYKGYVNAIRDLIDIPSADVQEVVWCKDCKYLKYDRDFITGRYCSLRNVNGGKYCNDDDYCSYGKRMDGEKE